MIAVLFGALIATLIQGTVSQPDCKKYDFKPRACRVSEIMEKNK